jgi:hypothetical protein
VGENEDVDFKLGHYRFYQQKGTAGVSIVSEWMQILDQEPVITVLFWQHAQ